MLPAEEWRHLIEAAAANRPAPVHAETFVRRLDGTAEPVLLRCNDGRQYVVKGQQAGRVLVTDHIVGLLGQLLRAPVPPVRVVEVAAGLVNSQAELHHVTPGQAHGSEFIAGCGDPDGIGPEEIVHFDLPANRQRFAKLAILYGWTHAADRQFIYQAEGTPLVYSVDHGHFLPGGPQWTIESLTPDHRARPDGQLRRKCGLTPQEIAEACQPLSEILDEDIAQVVAAPPTEWGIGMEERVALATYLSRRRDQLQDWVRCNSRRT